MLIFENCSFCYEKDAKGGQLFIVGIKDREHSNDDTERWNMVSLTEKETRQIYEMLNEYFKEES